LFKRKKSVAVFRGALTHHLREELALFSQLHPTLADAGLTKFVLNPRSNITLSKDIPLLNQLRTYKYIFYVDGHGTADRLPKLLASDSTAVLMPSTPDTHNLQMEDLGMPGRPVTLIEFFSLFLQPGVHFHPFRSDLSDLEQQLSYLQTHDEYAQKVAENGTEFVQQMLTRAQVQCYMHELAMRYLKLQRDSGAEILAEIRRNNPLLVSSRFEYCDPLVRKNPSARCLPFVHG